MHFRIYCTFHHDEAGIFRCFCIIWKLLIRWGRCQLQFLNLPTASSNHAGGAILSLYDTLQSSVFKLCQICIEKMWKSVVKACKLLKSLSMKPWGSSKEILWIYCFSLPDEVGENIIYQFLSFSVYSLEFWLSQGGVSFYGYQKRDEGADTVLMFQFCLPYIGHVHIGVTCSLIGIHQSYTHYKLSPSSLSTLKTVVDACWHSEIKCDIEQKAYSEVNWNET